MKIQGTGLNHTRGPWATHAHAPGRIVAEGNLIATAHDCRGILADGTTHGSPADPVGLKAIANARLIAAAPDLLAALRTIAACIPDSHGGLTLGTWERGIVAEAIAKATK